MNSFRILVVLVIILGLVITGQRIASQSKEKKQSVVTESPTPTDSPTSTPISNPASSPTTQPSPMSIPPATSTPTNPPTNQSLNITDFKYPDTIIMNANGNNLELESNDDPKKITDWYKDKIKSKNLSVTTFVQTNTNGNVLNKLVGASSNTEVRVEITKQNDSEKVKITISLIS